MQFQQQRFGMLQIAFILCGHRVLKPLLHLLGRFVIIGGMLLAVVAR